MYVQPLTKATLALPANANGANYFTLAKSSWMFDSVKTATTILVYSEIQATGQTFLTVADSVGGTSIAAQQVQPSFFPVATRGAECGALVDSLAWADSNLYNGYEWAKLATSPAVYFVSGVLNSSQTLSNDPFEVSAGRFFQYGWCWSGDYVAQVKPLY